MWLQTRMFLLVALLFAILYGAITAVGTAMGAGGFSFYIIMAVVMLGIQYMIGPSLVAMSMKIRWVSEQEEPRLHRMVEDQARRAGIPKPRVGISEMNIPNAFAFGRTHKDGRVCVTRPIMNLLNEDELRAVIGHEISHIKHRDMAVITVLSAIPMIMYWIAWSFMFRGMFGGRRDSGNNAMLIGMAAMVLYFITNLLVLYGSRIREYYADRGSVRLGNSPHHMATALYKLALGSARMRGSKELKEAESARAFFVNDPARAMAEVSELAQVDWDRSGTIDASELADLRSKTVKITNSDKMMEAMSTHPNMLKRIQHLSTLSG